LLRWEVLWGRFFGRLDGTSIIDTVFAAACRFGSIQACLSNGVSMSRVLVRTGAYLDQILALGLGDERLKLGSCEGVDQTCLGDDEEENLSTSQDRQFVCLAMGQ
jgi:hypothetical protein